MDPFLDPITQHLLAGAALGLQHGIILGLALMTIIFTIPALAGTLGITTLAICAAVSPQARPHVAPRLRAYTKVLLPIVLAAATTATILYLTLLELTS